MKVIGTDKNGDEIAEVSVTELDTMFKEIRAKAIDEFAERLHNLCGWEEDDFRYPYLLHESRIDEIAEELKAGGKE